MAKFPDLNKDGKITQIFYIIADLMDRAISLHISLVSDILSEKMQVLKILEGFALRFLVFYFVVSWFIFGFSSNFL